MEGRDDRHAQFAQEGQDVAAGLPAEDAVLELQAHQIDVVDVQEVGGAPVGVDVLLGQLEANAGRIVVAGLGVVDGQGDARRFGICRGDRLAEIRGERRDAALPRHVVADKGDAPDRRGDGSSFHDGTLLARTGIGWDRALFGLEVEHPGSG